MEIMRHMFHRYLLFSVLICVLSPGMLNGEEAHVSSLTSWEETISATRENNPAIAAARDQWRAAQEKIPQQRAFPDPMAGFVTMPVELQTRSGPVKAKYSISQKFPFFGKRGLKGTMAEQEALIAEQSYRSKSLDVYAQVAGAYYDLYFLDQSVKVNEDLADQIRHFARVAERKFVVGKQSQASVFRAQVELARILNDLITLRQERMSTLARLNALLSRPPRTPAIPQTPSHPPWTLTAEALQPIALDNRPEMRAAQSLVSRSKAEQSLVGRDFFPDLTIGYERTVIGAGTTNTSFDGRDAQGVSFQFNLPIWYNRLVPQSREAAFHRQSSQSLLEDWKNRTLYEVEDKVVKVETAHRLLALYEDTILPQAKQALNSSQKGYESDEVGFLELLDSVRSLLKFEQDYSRYQADYAQRRIDLERVIGVPLVTLAGDPHAN
jgi:cobalt-zinc-cadmium efflux system outer membrane protein